MIKENKIAFTDLSSNWYKRRFICLIFIHFIMQIHLFFLIQPFYHYWRANETSVTSGYKPNLKNQWFKLYSIIESFLT